MNIKGAFWVGDIYQKFENMCMEVEEAMYEDTVKFVESQVQNVGSNMKKFYTDVMQDIVSPASADPVKAPITDSCADAKIDKNEKLSNKEVAKKVDDLFAHDQKEIDQVDGDVLSFDEHIKQRVNSCSRGFNKGSYLTRDKNGEQEEDTTIACKKLPKNLIYRKTASKNQMSKNHGGALLVSGTIQDYATNDHMVLASPQASVEVAGWEWDSRDEEKEQDSCVDTDNTKLSVDDSTAEGPISANILSSQTMVEGLAEDSIEADSPVKFYVLGDSKTSQLTGELVGLSKSGRFSNCDKDVIEIIDSTDPKMETSGKYKIKLEETCVIVNGNDLPSISHKGGKSWSYKKKMREAFSLKKNSSRRQEYKKLVTQYGDANTSSSLVGVNTVPHTPSRNSNTAELQTHEFCESDWELL